MPITSWVQSEREVKVRQRRVGELAESTGQDGVVQEEKVSNSRKGVKFPVGWLNNFFVSLCFLLSIHTNAIFKRVSLGSRFFSLVKNCS